MTGSDLVRHWFHNLWELGNESTIDECLAPGMVVRGLAEADLVGREQFRAFYRSFRAAFPTIRVNLERVLESGEFVTCLARAELYSADGRGPFRIYGSATVRVEDGMFVEGWNSWDFLSLLMQMGHVRPDAMAVALTEPAIPVR